MGLNAASLGDARGRIILDPAEVLNGMRQAQNAARAGFDGITNSIRGVGDTLTTIGGGMTKLLLPIKAAGAVGVKVYGDFDSVLSEIQARTGATAKEMENVRKTALQMGQDTSFSATQSADAILQLLASGYDLNQTFAALPSVLNAAAAGGLNLGYTADVVTDVLAMWGMEATEAGRVADALAKGAAASSAEINDLSQGLGNVGPLAAQFGLSLEDTVAILAAFSERGIKGADAGNQLKTMLTQMSRGTTESEAAWRKVGISMYDAEGNVRPLHDIMLELNKALAGMTDAERISVIQDLAGSFGQLGLSVLTSEDAMGDMLTLMDQQTDAATVAEARLNNLNGIFGMMRSSIETLLINAMGPSIENGLKPFLKQVTELINAVNQWVLLNPELTTQIVSFLSILVSVGPAMYTVGTVMKTIAPMFSAYGTIVSWIIKLLPLLISPLGILIGVVALLAVAWSKNLFGIQDVVYKVLRPIMPWLELFKVKIEQIVKALLEGDFERALSWVQDLFGAFVDFLSWEILPRLGGWAQSVLDWIGEMVPPIVAKLWEWVQAFIEWVAPMIPPLLERLGELATQIIEWVSEQVPIVVARLQMWAQAFVDWIGPQIPPLLARLSELASQLIGWVASQVPVVIDRLRQWAQAFVDWVGPQIPPLLAQLAGLASQFLGWVGDQLPGIAAKIEEWAAAFVDWVGPAIENLLLALPGMSADVLIWVMEVTPDIIAQLLEWAAAFIDWVGPVIGDLIVKLGELSAAVIEWVLSEWIPAILAEMPGLVSAFISFVGDAITEIGPAFLDFLTAVTDFFVYDLLPAVWDAGQSIGTGIVTGIKNGLLNVGQQIFDYIKNQIAPYANRELIGGSGISLNNIGRAFGQVFDAGGHMSAGQVGLVGVGAQPELWVPDRPGTMVPSGQYSLGDTYHISLGITPETMRQYPNAVEYGETAGDALEQRLRDQKRFGGGGVARG